MMEDLAADANKPHRAVTSAVRAMPLAMAQVDERVRIVSFRGAGRGLSELQAAGLTPDREVGIVSRQAGGGVLITIDGRRFAIGSGLSQRIWVRPIADDRAPAEEAAPDQP